MLCPVCQLDYTSTGPNQPRLLVTCGHTFCFTCLENCKPPDGSDRIECPQCSLVSEVPHAPNITIINFVDAQLPKPGTQVVHQLPAAQTSLCQDCQKRLATLICFQCLPAGFKFCETCSEREHSRDFGPVQAHVPRPIASVRFQTPVPNCQIHPGHPCLFFSFKANKFACEECKSVQDFQGEQYISIDEAVSRVRDELPNLIQLVRDRVDTVSQTRSELNGLLKHVDLEKAKTMDRVRVEFNQFELFLKKRLQQVEGMIEDEAVIQKKALMNQEERLEVAQGQAETSLVQANMLLQMPDYSHLHQSETIIGNIKAQLGEEDGPLYQGPVAKGDIPIFISPTFPEDINKLGIVGGGKSPIRPTSTTSNGLLVLKWEPPSDTSSTKEYEIQYEPVEDDTTDPSTISTNRENYPQSIVVKGTFTEKTIDDIMPGKKYCFRVRSQNQAGWGIWSSPIVGRLPNFPIEIGYTGEVVKLQIPCDGLYCITARGAKAADGESCEGGRGAIVEAKFYLNKYDKLLILCGGMSQRVGPSSGGGGGTFVAVNRLRDLLMAAGGGGGTRGYDTEDHNGRHANIDSTDGSDGVGTQWAEGGADGGAGRDAVFTGPSWGYGGGGFHTSGTTAKSFMHGGESADGGGFGGGGGVGHYGGGGGGGYSGGGGGRGGGGGGCFVKEGGLDERRSLGRDGHGCVTIVHVDTE